MSFLGVHLYPDLLEQHWRELKSERERDRQIKAWRAARRAARPSRLATLTARLRHARQPSPRPRTVGC